jgi:hypothetical protein
VNKMTTLLHQLTTTPTYEHTIWIILLVSVGITMLSFISRLEDAEKFTSVIIPFIIFIAFSILFGSLQNHINQQTENAISNKEYTLTLNGAILEFTSNSPYLKSETLDIVYQDDKRFQIKYNNQYFDIDKSQEKINATN